MDVVTLDICGRDRLLTDKCLDGMLTYMKKSRDENVNYSYDSLKLMLRDEIKRRFEKEYIDFVLVKENLSPDEMKEMEAFSYSGVALVLNNLYVDPTSIADSAFVSAKFQSALGLTKQDADFRVSKRPLRYLKIIRRMNLTTKDFIDARLADEKSAMSKGFLKEEEGISEFLILEPHPTRFYPEKNLGGQITGFVDNENVGRYGIEAYYQDYLQGQEGERQTRKDASGRTIGGYDL